jgi:hypothetical protein
MAQHWTACSSAFANGLVLEFIWGSRQLHVVYFRSWFAIGLNMDFIWSQLQFVSRFWWWAWVVVSVLV